MLTRRVKLGVAAGLALAVAGAITGTAIADSSSPAPHKLIWDRTGPDTQTPAPGDVQTKPADPSAATGPTGPVAQAGEGTIQPASAAGNVSLPFSPGTIDLSDFYLGHSGADYVDLYAGASGTSASDGLLIVQVSDPTGAQALYPSGQFTLPGTGTLSLQQVAGNLVTLTDGSGTVHVFSLLTDQFS